MIQHRLESRTRQKHVWGKWPTKSPDWKIIYTIICYSMYLYKDIEFLPTLYWVSYHNVPWWHGDWRKVHFLHFLHYFYYFWPSRVYNCVYSRFYSCTALHCTVLHCTALHFTESVITMFLDDMETEEKLISCIFLHYFYYFWPSRVYNCVYSRFYSCTALHCTALHCTALHCTALHCTALHCTAHT